jgi:CRISPR/Cas system-associated protein Cas10 (large subunit of type III CRISPR-Cas system)
VAFQYLVVSDTNNVVSYLFSNTRYRFIRGASSLLDYLNLDITRKIASQNNGTVLSLGGGEARILFHTEEEAMKFEQEIRKAYLDHTDEVTLSLAIVKRQSKESMEKWLERAEAILRVKEKQEDKKTMPLLPLFPLVERCEGCKKRPAEKYYPLPDGRKKLCLSCFKKAFHVTEIIEKLNEFANSKNYHLEEITGLMDIHRMLITQREKDQKGSSWVRKIADLLKSEQQSGRYIGFVYADGKKLGSFFRKTVIDTLQGQDDDEFIEKYQTFSKKVHDSIIQAAVYTQQLYNGYSIDYAMVGGDDFVAIMPGEIAVSYTNTLIQKFEQLTAKAFLQNGQENGLMMGAGVVIAHVGYPLYRMFQLSYDLMSIAKQKYTDKSVIDFIKITDSTVQSIGMIKEYENTSFKTGVPLRNKFVRMNGFVVDRQSNESIDKLLEIIKLLKAAQFPRSKIKVLYEILREENEYQLRFEWLKWRARIGKEIKKIFDEWDVKFKETPFPFMHNGTSYSPLLDLFDLYDITPSEVNHDDQVV